MASNIEAFTRRLYDEWLPAFCDDEKRDRYDISGFKAESIKISDYDASNFIRALDGGLVKDTGGGRYRCARCGPFTQIFWSGSKLVAPCPLTLWIEPIITIGTVARLGLDYGWPSQYLGMQQKGSAFDLAVYKSESGENEFIAGEVKKTVKEVDRLMSDLMEFGELGITKRDSDDGKRINSFKKWLALLCRQAPLLWTVGPNDYTHLFAVRYFTDHKATFTEVQLDQLEAPKYAAPVT